LRGATFVDADLAADVGWTAAEFSDLSRQATLVVTKKLSRSASVPGPVFTRSTKRAIARNGIQDARRASHIINHSMCASTYTR
jgi:hypothetical protein